MRKKEKKGSKGRGAEKTALKTEKKLAAKQRKLLEKLKETDIAEVVAKLEADEECLMAVTETVCPPPSPRSSFTIVSHPEKEELIFFGGELFNGQKVFVYNDLFFYNIKKGEWRQVRSPSGPAPRSGHQMVAVPRDGGQLWVFGGEYASPSQTQFYHYKDLWVFIINTKKWEKINAPNGPSARSGHRMLSVKKRLVVFGGFYDNVHSYKYYNDLHIFSLENYTWLEISLSGNPPAPRSGHCMSAYSDGKILIWGGYSKSPEKKGVDHGFVHTDMYALMPEKSDSLKTFKWMKLKPGGFKPLPRSGVGHASGPNGKVYCFGGVMDLTEDEENIQGQFGNDLLVLDLSSQTWRLLDVTKKAKSTNKSTVIDVSMKVVDSEAPSTSVSMDGIFTLTSVGVNPESCNTAGNSAFHRECKSIPSPRMQPGMCVCRNILYIFGGIFEAGPKQITLNDFYALDLHKQDEWRVIIPNNANPHDWDNSETESCSDNSDETSDFDSSEDESEMDTE